MQRDFMGLHVREKKVVFWNAGTARFAMTTMEQTALAVRRSLLVDPVKTANRTLYVQEFATSQAELHKAIEKITGEKWSTESIDSRTLIADAKHRFARGDVSGAFALTETGFATNVGSATDFTQRGTDNDLLGLEPQSIDEVIKAALEAAF
jgi:hypothetical protein